MPAVAGGVSPTTVLLHPRPLAGTMAPNAPVAACFATGTPAPVHDLRLSSSSLQTLLDAPSTFYAQYPNGTVGTTYRWSFGDGTSVTSTVPSANHTYRVPGLYAVCAQSTDRWGGVHDSRSTVLAYPVADAGAANVHGLLSILTGRVVHNTTAATGATPLLAPGGAVTVEVAVAMTPSNPSSLASAPAFHVSANAAPYASLSGVTLSTTGTSRATVTFASTTPGGTYEVTFALPATGLVNGAPTSAWSNFTFTVEVGHGLGGDLVPHSASSHAASLRNFEYAPGGPYTLDPAIDYESVGAEVIGNVYQNLIDYDQASVATPIPSFLPDLSVCVPGSGLCRALFGTPLTSSTTMTFVITNVSQFYDPATGASWGVWPTDVMFSMLRTMGFATYPCYSCNNGWMISQSLLPQGNASWDGALHAIVNNTPAEEFTAVGLNQSAYCPAAAVVAFHGCVTFHFATPSAALGSARFLLETLANPLGGAIVPCGWYSAPAQGAGVPYWTSGNVSGSGDHPCPAPGVGGYGVAPSTVPATGWDAWEIASGAPPFTGNVTMKLAGSGPYYLRGLSVGSSADLAVNPAWSANPSCTVPGCPPSTGPAYRSVSITWETTPTTGEKALAAGGADVVQFPQSDSALLAADVAAGIAGVRVFPGQSASFVPLNLEYNVSVANAIANQTFTAPSGFLADLNLRQFLIHAYPYDAAIGTGGAASGIRYRFESGGPIPSYFGASTPTNIGWPSGSADTNPSHVGGAAWWWNRTAHDNLTGGLCTRTKPCTFPMFYVLGDPTQAQAAMTWAKSVTTISHGAIRPFVQNESFIQAIINALYSPPGGSPQAVASGLGWVPDYPDPTDVLQPTFAPDSTYTFSDAVAEVLLPSGAYNASSCPSSLAHYAALTTPIPNNCQGAAYGALSAGMRAAADGPLTAARLTLYDEIEEVANALGLYAWTGQTTQVLAYAPWIDPSSFPAGWETANGIMDWVDVAPLRHATPLALNGPAISPDPVTLGSSVTLLGLATGGEEGYVYAWTGLPSGCASSNTAQLHCTPTARGTYTVTLSVTDAKGTKVTSAVTFTVSAPRRRDPTETE